MELSTTFVKMIQGAEQHLCPLYCGVVDRRRVIAYFFLTLIEVIVIPIHFIMFLLNWEPWGFSVCCVHLGIFAVLQIAIWKNDMSFDKGIASLFLLVFFKLAIDSVFCTAFGKMDDQVTVLGNIFIMFILAISALSLMLQSTAATISIGILPIIAFYLTLQKDVSNLFALKSFLVGAMMICYVFTYNMSRVTKGLRQPRELGMEEKKALDMLANLKDMTPSKATTLMDKLSPELRQRLIEHATEKLKNDEVEQLAWDMVCVELTETEKKICKLVLQDKNVKDICSILNKTTSAVTSTRCHIRKKLNMERTEDLKRTLEMKIAEIRTAI